MGVPPLFVFGMKGKIKKILEKARRKVSSVTKRASRGTGPSNDNSNSKSNNNSKNSNNNNASNVVSDSKFNRSDFDDDPIALLPLIGDIYIECRILYRYSSSIVFLLLFYSLVFGLGLNNREHRKMRRWAGSGDAEDSKADLVSSFILMWLNHICCLCIYCV